MIVRVGEHPPRRIGDSHRGDRTVAVEVVGSVLPIETFATVLA
jgi:hypothetical protein